MLLSLLFRLRLLFGFGHLALDGGAPIAGFLFGLLRLRNLFLFLLVYLFKHRRLLCLAVHHLQKLCLQSRDVLGVLMHRRIPEGIVQFLFEIVHGPRRSLLEKELGIVHIRKDFANPSLVLKLRLAHLHEIHKAADVSPKIPDRALVLVFLIKKSHGNISFVT